MMTMDGLHVIFGTGPVGLAILAALRADHPTARVRMVNRSGKVNVALPDGVTLVTGDARDAAFAVEAARGAAVVYQALNPAYSQWVPLFPALQAGALAAAAAHGAHYVSMDNLYMYGDTGGAPIHEGLPESATTKKGALRARMAADVLAAHQAGRVQAVIGRASDFYGPGVHGSAYGDTVFGNLHAGKAAQVLGNPDAPHALTYVADVGRALVALAGRADAYGQVWILPTAPAVTQRAFVTLAAEALRVPPKLSAAPPGLLRVIGLFNADLGEIAEMGYAFTQPYLVDDSRFTRAFGWGATPLIEGVAATAAAWRAGAPLVR